MMLKISLEREECKTHLRLDSRCLLKRAGWGLPQCTVSDNTMVKSHLASLSHGCSVKDTSLLKTSQPHQCQRSEWSSLLVEEPYPHLHSPLAVTGRATQTLAEVYLVLMCYMTFIIPFMPQFPLLPTVIGDPGGPVSGSNIVLYLHFLTPSHGAKIILLVSTCFVGVAQLGLKPGTHA